MTWHEQWTALDGRLAGLLEAGHFVMRSLQVNTSDAYGVTNRVSRHAREVAAELADFGWTYQASLPPRALAELQRFVAEDKLHLDQAISGFNGVQLSITILASLRAALNYHLADFTVVARRRSERAFLHLQQLIVADPGVRVTWESAYEQGELACERLGGAHLLSHGIWAFKAHGPGARTDLVLGEPITDASDVERVAEALVLTEWKLVRDPPEAEAIAEGARTQASLYGAGILSGIELASYRYIVLVSRPRLPKLPDIIQDGITYRHVNIAVAPAIPSKAA
jgi:hypothetical protein